jgi:aryl-alcohol dehydrogenase-like predicted oxidoreductase
MQKRKIGSTDLVAAPIGLGCMGMSSFYGERDDNESTMAVQRALDLGVTLIDTADVYGPWTNEVLVGKAIAGRRDEVILASKCGLEVDDTGTWTRRINGRPDYIRKSIDGSLRRLGVDHIDLYYLHRVDLEVPIEESFGALGELVVAGKVLRLGLCEAAPDTIARANDTARLSAIQTEYSLFSRDVEQNGVLDICRELDLAFVAYSPLGRGFLSGAVRSVDDFAPDDIRRDAPRFQGENFAKNLELVDLLSDVAVTKGITASQLAIAWVVSRGPNLFAIPGTRKPARVAENAAAGDVDLSADDLAAIESVLPFGGAAGPRYAENFMQTTYR